MPVTTSPISTHAPERAKRGEPTYRPAFAAAWPWIVAGLVLLLAGLMLSLAAAGDGALPGDLSIARTIQQPASTAIDAAARTVSLIGDDFPGMVLLALLAVAILLARGRRDLALFVAVAAALRAVGPLLKRITDSPRPPAGSLVILDDADGLGFPSGHAMGAALFYGAIVVVVPEVVTNRVLARVGQAGAVVMMVLIALSRVRLGVHWPSDVAGGLVVGFGLVCLLRAAALGWSRHAVRT